MTAESVRLRESSGHDDLVVMTPERRGLWSDALRAAVDLIGEEPGAVSLRDRRDVDHLRRGEDLAGRVVRVADADDLRAVGDRGLQLVEVDAPAPLLP